MTEYEIADLALSNAEALRSQRALIQDQAALIYDRLNLFYTMLFGYLTVAYLVGPKLTKIQVGVFNLLYISVIVINRVVTFRDLQVQRSLRLEFNELLGISQVPEQTGLPGFVAVLAIAVVMVIASLIFMWNVRHPKTE